jgi:hypothetical protein
MKLPKKAIVLIGAMTLAGLTTLAGAVSTTEPMHGYRALVLLFLAFASARLKLKLPGLTGNMAVNLPFLLIAVTQLSLLEALLVALPACALQCLPKSSRGGLGKPKPVQLLFNLSTTAVAVGAAHLAGGGLAVLAAAAFFVVQTLPVAGIIALTEGGVVGKVWFAIAQLSFPFYVLSAGITSIVIGSRDSQLVWQFPLIGLPVLYAVYRSYQSYFREDTPQ